MLKLNRFIIREINLPLVVVVLAMIMGIYHLFSYMIPFTDNAFVVTNVTPVAADVSGFISKIHVRNGQQVEKNDPIFTVYQKPYQFAYAEALADYQQGKQRLVVLATQIAKVEALIRATAAELNKLEYELNMKQERAVAEAVAHLEIKKLSFDVINSQQKLASLQQEVAVLRAQISEQHHVVASLKAKMDNAQLNLDLTVVRAPSKGVVDNLYVAAQTPIKIHEPVFSFIDTSNYYIQANFNETDLRKVRVGDKAYIILRMYYFDKVFHGVVANSLWAAERQTTVAKSQLQKVQNENEWLLLPQRFPVQIKILDLDPSYPLNPGASAYVYIATSH